MVHDIHDRTKLESLSAKICTDVVYGKNIRRMGRLYKYI